MGVKTVATVALVAGLVIGAGAVAVVLGVGPLGGNSASGGEISDFPTATGTPYSDGSNSGSGSDTSGDSNTNSDTGDSPPFSFTIDNTESCGDTCRDVTATLTNEQNETATGTTVYTRIYAGKSTAESDLIWQGKQDIGTLEAGASATRTQRVKLSYGEAYSVQQNDGWITVVTTVQTDDQTVTFKNERNVL